MNDPTQQRVSVAEQLRAVYDSHEPIAPIRESIASVEEAYAVQDLNTSRWIDQGRRLVGRKIGLTSLRRPTFGLPKVLAMLR